MYTVVLFDMDIENDTVLQEFNACYPPSGRSRRQSLPSSCKHISFLTIDAFSIHIYIYMLLSATVSIITARIRRASLSSTTAVSDAFDLPFDVSAIRSLFSPYISGQFVIHMLPCN